METGADSALPPSQHIVRPHRAEAEAHVVSPRWPNLDAVSHAPHHSECIRKQPATQRIGNRLQKEELSDPVGIQTQDLQNRNLTLYSAKLRDLSVNALQKYHFFLNHQNIRCLIFQSDSLLGV